MGTDPTGQTWEYIYLLDEIKNQEISYESFNNAVGYNPNYVIQGFSVLKPDKSESVIEAFDLESSNYFPDTISDTYQFSLDKLLEEESLNQEYKASARKEQTLLRKKLFGTSKKLECSICKEEFPIGFLVAAHIKKRAHCSNDEMLDIENIVLPMCKFGCDDLFEKGYISVKDGEVITKKHLIVTSRIEKHIDKVVGNNVTQWNSGSLDYFNWHLNHHNF